MSLFFKYKKKKKHRKNTRKTHKKHNKLKKYTRKIQKGGAFTVTIGDPSKYIITTNLNKINNSTIFKFEHGTCIKHFQVKDEDLHFDFLYLDYISTNTGILVKRNADTDTSNIEKIITFINNNQPIYKHADFLKQHNIITLVFTHPIICETEIDISATIPIIETLNASLKDKCDNLSLSLNYIYNMNWSVVSYSSDIAILVLCLNHPTEGCISSVEVIINGVDLNISSKTKDRFEGKKYNKLLRAAVIIIAPLLNCQTLTSNAVNPISTWLLMNSFNATTTDEELIVFLNEKGVLESDEPDQIITKDILTKELIQEYHRIMDENDEGEIFLTIDLTNPENIQKAQDVFNELISTETETHDKEIICPT